MLVYKRKKEKKKRIAQLMFHRSLFFFSDFIARTVNRFNRLSIYFEDKYYPKVYSSNLKLIVPRVLEEEISGQV